MTVYTYEVKVQSVGGSNKFHIDGYQQPSLALGHDITYRFDVSDSSNAGHVFQFSTTSDGTHGGGTALGSSDGYTTSGTAGSSGAYVELDVTSSTASTLYYFCGSSGHTGMGGTAVTTSAEYVSASNVALRKPILGNSDSWGHYINQNLDTIAGKLPANFTFPTDAGTDGNLLTSDGSGGTAWEEPSPSNEIELTNAVTLSAETITYQKMYLGNTFTVGGNLTVNGNLVLGKIIADSTAQTLSGSGYTITGTGQITMNATLV